MNKPVFPAKQAWFILELYTPEYDPNSCYVSDFTVVVDNTSELNGIFCNSTSFKITDNTTTNLTSKETNITDLTGIIDNVSDFVHEC